MPAAHPTPAGPSAPAARPLAVYTDLDDLDAGPGVDVLERAGFAVSVLETRDADEIVAAARGAVALLVGYAPITAAMLDALPDLRIIALLSRGADTVDVPAATARGIWVANLDDLSSDEVAEHTWAMTLTLLRRLPFFAAAVRRGAWLARPEPPPRRLSEVTIGLLGLGRIGAKVAALADGHVGGIVGYDPYLPESATPAGVRRTDLDEAVRTADVLCLHLPLTAETGGLVDADLLARMPAGSFLVNPSRGGLVDPAALVAALDSGHLAGAALDVLDVEPPPADHPLLHRDDVVLTPHIGYLSATTRRSYPEFQAGNVVAWLETGTPLSPLNSPAPRSTERSLS
ncbi:C-terminal binding protein [Nakamurella flavida]|uniref:C-terminal binding protein n=1 Tax=Nakamurella flavida TaxID=363630 RepID=A0A939C286_9ACTN|nr:C-terminal binding protein [Nakamurella flavida]MBM9476295.1 C-terminal binding protein [Nakamurella flavida]MDP9779605.1 D-3-phosphoglycerate dehydrogenase [Nakamurella flavida]